MKIVAHDHNKNNKTYNPSSQPDGQKTYLTKKQVIDGAKEKLTHKLGFGIPLTTDNPIIQLSLRCDRLSITGDVGADDKDAVKSAIFQLAGDPEFAVTSFDSSGGYRINRRIHLQSGAKMTLQVDPVRSELRFMRIDLNPAKVGPEGILELDGILDFCTPCGADHFISGRVTRCDVALDLIGVEWESLLISPRYSTDTMAYVKRSTGSAQTLYFGARTSKDRWACYDKGNEADLPVPCVRLERRIRTAMSWAQLQKLKNPFTNLVISRVNPQRPKGVDAVAWGLFLQLAKVAGPSAALAKIPAGNERKKRKSALKAATPNWWQPDLFWQAWPKLLADLGLAGSSEAAEPAGLALDMANMVAMANAGIYGNAKVESPPPAAPDSATETCP